MSEPTNGTAAHPDPAALVEARVQAAREALAAAESQFEIEGPAMSNDALDCAIVGLGTLRFEYRQAMHERTKP